MEQKAELIDAMFKAQIWESYTIKSERVDDMMAMITDYWKINDDKYDEMCEKNRQIALEREKNKREKKEHEQHERAASCENSTDSTDSTDKIRLDKIRYLEYVYLKEEEYFKLVEMYGEKVAKDFIERLDNRIWMKPNSKDRKNRDHYRTILNWIKKEGINKLPPKPSENETWIYDLPF